MKVILTDEADADRHRIWLFHATWNVDYADRVDTRFRERLTTFGSMPHQGRAIGRTWRQLSIPDVQLAVRYRIDEDAVRILRVWSTRQDRDTR